MQINRIGYQPNFNAYFNNDKDTVDALKCIYKSADNNQKRLHLIKSLYLFNNMLPNEKYKMQIDDIGDELIISRENASWIAGLSYNSSLVQDFDKLVNHMVEQKAIKDNKNIITQGNFIKLATKE